MTGRPPVYTEELAAEVCRRLVEGCPVTKSRALYRICEQDDMPAQSTVFLWVVDDVDGFSEKYRRARALQTDVMLDECPEIADDGARDTMTISRGGQDYEVENKEWTSRSKLRVDTRLRMAAMTQPKKYGPLQKLANHDGGELRGGVLVVPEQAATSEEWEQGNQ